MLKIFQARLQQCRNLELVDVQAEFIKSRGTRDQIANNLWIQEKAREFQKISTSISLTIKVDHNKLENSYGMGLPDHLTCLLRNLYARQEATVRTRHGTMDWFQIGKVYLRAVYCHPAYLTYMQSTS